MKEINRSKSISNRNNRAWRRHQCLPSKCREETWHRNILKQQKNGEKNGVKKMKNEK